MSAPVTTLPALRDVPARRGVETWARRRATENPHLRRGVQRRGRGACTAGAIAASLIECGED